MVAFQRRNAVSSHPRERPERMPSSCLQLFNPNLPPVPSRHSPAATSPHKTLLAPHVVTRKISHGASRYLPPRNAPTSLFDPREDDPARFAVLARPSSTGARPPPTPKSSGDYVSASSTSSYAHLLTSSFTLSSGTTDNSSASSALFVPHFLKSIRRAKPSSALSAYEARFNGRRTSPFNHPTNETILAAGAPPQDLF
ncbi:hypothetical protein EV424DRAFT_1615577 [Suillus variegatus]|nr:hypothetical protein EV424DRAFT_1615577 [Suillus variegatus]